MITSERQAREVQARRRVAGKCGVAKAVRRWARRNHDTVERFPKHTRPGWVALGYTDWTRQHKF